jgi:hypothetical protein
VTTTIQTTGLFRFFGTEDKRMFELLARLFGNEGEKKTPSKRSPARVVLGVEELTPRVLLNAGSWGLTWGQDFHASHFDRQGFGGDRHASSSTLFANLTDSSGATGQALFNERTGTLTIEVKGAATKSALTVAVGGTTIGTLTTHSSGDGHLRLANQAISAGQAITVGDLQGTFAQEEFSATLTGSAGASGNAEFDALDSRLEVSIKGAAAKTTYNVSVDGTVVGQITTDRHGSGYLRTSLTSSVAITSASTISIAADTAGASPILQGTFA